MGMLRLGVRLQDFDLERVGFSLVILGRDEEQDAHGYLRMTLEDLDRLVAALRAEEAIELVALDREDADPTDASAVPDDDPEPEADIPPLPWMSRTPADGGGAVRVAAPLEEAPRRFLRKRRQPG